MCFAFPDVLKTPAPIPAGFIPIPYPNIGQCAMAVNTAIKVKILNMPALHKGSIIPMSMGGAPGSMGGVVAPFYMSSVAYKMGSMTVKIEGNPAVTVLKPTAHNGSNPNAPMGVQVAPSQTMVLVSG